MDRRTFLEKTGLALSAAVLPMLGAALLPRSRYKMGYQLYSVNNDMNDNPIGTLQALKAMGYRDFEIYGFDDQQISYYGIPAVELKSLLDDMGLTVASGHYGFTNYLLKPQAELDRFVDQCIKGADALESPYITWPWLAPELRTIENFKLMADKLNVIGERISAAGLGFAYHNHGFEFEDYNGENGYDIILSNTEPELVKLQLDMYWVVHSSTVTPKEWVDRQAGRIVMWHIKDMDKVTRDYTELGNGSIDYTQVMPDPEKSGLEYFYIEQGGNFTHSAMKSAEDSARYFKKYLSKML